jgi:hypothetical protein
MGVDFEYINNEPRIYAVPMELVVFIIDLFTKLSYLLSVILANHNRIDISLEKYQRYFVGSSLRVENS